MEVFYELNENFNKIRNVSIGEKFSRSFEILMDGFKAYLKYPVLIIPIIFHIMSSLLILVVLFLNVRPYISDTNTIPTDVVVYIALGTCLLICATYTIGSFMMLEFIQQIEMGEKINVGKAFYESFCKDLIKGLPLMIIWTIISFIGKCLKGKRSKETFIGTCIRMSLYCIFPAIAWEDYDSIGAVKRGIKVLKHTYSEVFFSIIQTSFVGFLLAVPIALLIGIMVIFQVNVQTCFLLVLLIIGYAIFVGTLCEYIGQMFTASLYIWYIKWERETRNAKINHTSEPSLYDIPMPSLLDDIPDLVYRKKPSIL